MFNSCSNAERRNYLVVIYLKEKQRSNRDVNRSGWFASKNKYVPDRFEEARAPAAELVYNPFAYIVF